MRRIRDAPRVERIFISFLRSRALAKRRLTTFEIEERYRALDHELRIVQDNLALLIDMARQRRFEVLEIVVAVFVALETLLFVGQLLLHWK